MSDHSIADGQQPYDDRHFTPPKMPRENPFRAGTAAEEFLDKVNAMPAEPVGYPTPLHRAIGELRRKVDAYYFTEENTSDIRTVLDELEHRMGQDAERLAPVELAVPTPGLVYADPQARFECKPAEAAWREHAINASEMYSLLELRVMSAHLATALDNITKVLTRKIATEGTR